MQRLIGGKIHIRRVLGRQVIETGACESVDVVPAPLSVRLGGKWQVLKCKIFWIPSYIYLQQELKGCSKVLTQQEQHPPKMIDLAAAA